MKEGKAKVVEEEVYEEEEEEQEKKVEEKEEKKTIERKKDKKKPKNRRLPHSQFCFSLSSCIVLCTTACYKSVSTVLSKGD